LRTNAQRFLISLTLQPNVSVAPPEVLEMLRRNVGTALCRGQ